LSHKKTIAIDKIESLNTESTEKVSEIMNENNQTQASNNSIFQEHLWQQDVIQLLNINQIEPDPEQPRKYFDPVSLEQLKSSIESTSLIDPILVRLNGQNPRMYFIVDGERRWRACKELNYAQIKCRVIPTDSLDYDIIAFSQNVQREDLTTMEKSVALEKLFKRMKQKNSEAQQKNLISKVHLSKSYVSELLSISELDDYIKSEALKSTFWTRSNLLQLAKIKSSDLRKKNLKNSKQKKLK
jgi:ParB family chromosome partitioning protein